jgi:hypothetical protein
MIFFVEFLLLFTIIIIVPDLKLCGMKPLNIKHNYDFVVIILLNALFSKEAFLITQSWNWNT